MKHYIIISLSIVAMVCTSCSDFLNVTPEKSPSEGTFFLTDKDATDALADVYRIFGDVEPFQGRDIYWEQAGNDDLILGRSRGEDYNNLVNFTFTGRESPLRSMWEKCNLTVARANWVIYRLLRKGELSPVEKIRLGEAYFLRAFCHFYIAYRHGRADQGVPFDRYEDYDPYEYQIPEQRASVMENYDLIVQDLETAASYLPFFEDYGEEDYGRAHRVAAWAYIVKVYAYWAQHDASKWALIPPLVDRIESEGRRGLLDNYADVFTIANEWSREYIWSINSSGYNETGSIMPGVMLENKGWGRYNGWGFFKPTLGLYDEFVEGDKRRRVTILEYNDEFVFFGETRRYYSTSDLESGFQFSKYMEPYTYGTVVDGIGISDVIGPAFPTTDLNIPLIRHAEMVLFKAEALIQQGNGAAAATELNRLTRRAGLGDVYSNATMDNLKHERRCELAGELSDRLMDLKRWQEWDRLSAPLIGRHHEERDNPESPWTPVEIWPARKFNPATDIVYPYNPDDVVKAGGKLKQNPID
ncbi:MAG: RagB/SusD family nutrient uptake outer membrane protein [Tannerella sp.]|nr:RagB/SusD family nutrient uptake outer membrane protein [Tannerella sp.]